MSEWLKPAPFFSSSLSLGTCLMWSSLQFFISPAAQMFWCVKPNDIFYPLCVATFWGSTLTYCVYVKAELSNQLCLQILDVLSGGNCSLIRLFIVLMNNLTNPQLDCSQLGYKSSCGGLCRNNDGVVESDCSNWKKVFGAQHAHWVVCGLREKQMLSSVWLSCDCN